MISRRTVYALSALLVLFAAALNSRNAVAMDEFEDWDLEANVSKAHLVMVARVVRISAVTVVEGAKTDVSLREYRFEPVRVLKGLFQRDELSMTASDLGCSATSGLQAPPLEEGEFRLLILAQSQGYSFNGGIQSFGCVSISARETTFDERVPRLTGPDDPLVATVETLIRVADSRSRQKRATLLIDQLETASGISAVPLLTSLALRADWAAADPRAYAALARLAQDPAPAVRGGALSVLSDMLASGQTPRDLEALPALVPALSQHLQSDDPATRRRLAAIEALGYLQRLVPEDQRRREALIDQLTGAATHAERVAAATALSRGPSAAGAQAVLDVLASLPLDEPAEREAKYARAAERLDASGAARILLSRLQRSIAAGASAEAEIDALGWMRSKESLPTLLEFAANDRPILAERIHTAWALGRLSDERAVAPLTIWVQQNDYQLKGAALTALEQLDSDAVARAVRPLVKPESYLPFKLRMARLLARHSIDDGYALATEHLSDSEHMADASLVLAALGDPRTAKDLSTILEQRPDQQWRSAALTGLAAIGDATARRQLLQILGDERDPLAAKAAQAVGVAAEPGDLLPSLAKLVGSRNQQISLAALVALRRAFSDVRESPVGLAAAEWNDVPDRDSEDSAPSEFAATLQAESREAIAQAAADLAADAYVDANLRQEALAVARLVGGADYAQLLATLADQAELENSPLLTKVQAERRRGQQ